MYHCCCAGEPAVSGSVVRIETAGDRPLLPRPLILHEDALRAYATRRTHFVLMLHEDRSPCLFSLAPLLRGEGWGEGLSQQRDSRRVPLTRIASAMRSDLSPHAGRGKQTIRPSRPDRIPVRPALRGRRSRRRPSRPSAPPPVPPPPP